MKHIYYLTIAPNYTLEASWNLLEEAGLDLLYSEETKENITICISAATPEAFAHHPIVIAWKAQPLPAIDWEEQWRLHGHSFCDGHVHVDLTSWKPTAGILRLVPGPGFGDLSHPTTRLVLSLLASQPVDYAVCDIGCGSGILALTAAALGSPVVYGCDIEHAAVEHANQNAILNRLEEQCRFVHVDDLMLPEVDRPWLAAMNMIQSEQMIVWESLETIRGQFKRWVTSGIRVEEREAYLAQTALWHWKCLEERKEGEWLAFVFEQR